MSVSLAAAIAGAVFSIVVEPAWWMILIWAFVLLVMVLIWGGVWYSMGESAAATEQLRTSGVVTRAEVLSGARFDEDDEIWYELTLEIRPVAHEPFTVVHHCHKWHCKQAEQDAPTTITALVDATTRTWAVIHD